MWPEAVNVYRRFTPDEVQDLTVTKAVKMVKILDGEGFDVTVVEFNDFIDAHSTSLTGDDLVKITQSAREDGEETDVATEETTTLWFLLLLRPLGGRQSR